MGRYEDASRVLGRTVKVPPAQHVITVGFSEFLRELAGKIATANPSQLGFMALGSVLKGLRAAARMAESKPTVELPADVLEAVRAAIPLLPWDHHRADGYLPFFEALLGDYKEPTNGLGNGSNKPGAGERAAGAHEPRIPVGNVGQLDDPGPGGQ